MARRAPIPAACRKRPFSQLSLCLSRACLGRIIGFSKNGSKGRRRLHPGIDPWASREHTKKSGCAVKTLGHGTSRSLPELAVTFQPTLRENGILCVFPMFVPSLSW